MRTQRDKLWAYRVVHQQGYKNQTLTLNIYAVQWSCRLNGFHKTKNNLLVSLFDASCICLKWFFWGFFLFAVLTFLFLLCFCPVEVPGLGLPFLADFLSELFDHRQELAQSHLNTCWKKKDKWWSKIHIKRYFHMKVFWILRAPRHIKTKHCD